MAGRFPLLSEREKILLAEAKNQALTNPAHIGKASEGPQGAKSGRTIVIVEMNEKGEIKNSRLVCFPKLDFS